MIRSLLHSYWCFPVLRGIAATEPLTDVERTEPLTDMERAEQLTDVERSEPLTDVERSEPLTDVERSEQLTDVERSRPSEQIQGVMLQLFCTSSPDNVSTYFLIRVLLFRFHLNASTHWSYARGQFFCQLVPTCSFYQILISKRGV